MSYENAVEWFSPAAGEGPAHFITSGDMREHTKVIYADMFANLKASQAYTDAAVAAGGGGGGTGGGPGTPGADGVRGSIWGSGSVAPESLTPPASGFLAGDHYLLGTTGQVYRYSGTAWVPTVNIRGAEGPAGAPGATGPTGPTGATGARGADGTGVSIKGHVDTVGELPPTGNLHGDAYLVAGEMYVWTGTAWQNVGQIQGPPGADGATGATGPAGERGPAGPTGADGAPGATGAAGATGATGATGPTGPAGADGTAGALDDLSDVDVRLATAGMTIVKQDNGTWRGSHIRIPLNQLTDVTAPTTTPPNSLLGTVGEGATAGQAEWEPLHLDYVQNVVVGPLASTVATLDQRITELEHTDAIEPPDLTLGVDLYSGSYTRIIGCGPITASPSQRIVLTLATAPGPQGTVFATLGDISGTGAVWADFGGTLGKVVDSAGVAANGATLKEAIRRGSIATVHRGSDGTNPTLVVENLQNPADAGSSLTLDALKDVTAPANTPAGKVLGTTAQGAWAPVDAPSGLPGDGATPLSTWVIAASGSGTPANGHGYWSGSALVLSNNNAAGVRVKPASTPHYLRLTNELGEVAVLTVNTANLSPPPHWHVPSTHIDGPHVVGTVEIEVLPALLDGNVLTLHSGAPVWLPPAGGSTVAALDDLTDVDTTGAVEGAVLMRVGAGWEDRPTLAVVVKATEPVPADFGLTAIPLDAVWIRKA